VHTAENGHCAILKAKTQHFKFIILDLEMPICDGFEACAKIQAFHDAQKHEQM